MISIKKYLESEMSGLRSHAPEGGELLAAAVASYRAALLDMANSGYQACPAYGASLQQNLADIERRIADGATTALFQATSKDVGEQLAQWGQRTAAHLKGKAEEVKDLLIVLARTAESLGERDQRYASQLGQFTSRLRTVADLEDLTQVRSSLMETASELKSCVDQMELDSQQSIAELEKRVTTYESRLKETEELALRDVITGLPNRLDLERRIERRIANELPFSIAFLDLNHFKLVNDRLGHTPGDILLKQFSEELRSNLRPGDIVGRWGGDEFLILLDCDLATATAAIERIRQWAFGEYCISTSQGGEGVKVQVDAAIGLAERRHGDTMEQLIGRADRAMYEDKSRSSRGVSIIPDKRQPIANAAGAGPSLSLC